MTERRLSRKLFRVPRRRTIGIWRAKTNSICCLKSLISLTGLETALTMKPAPRQVTTLTQVSSRRILKKCQKLTAPPFPSNVACQEALQFLLAPLTCTLCTVRGSAAAVVDKVTSPVAKTAQEYRGTFRRKRLVHRLWVDMEGHSMTVTTRRNLSPKTAPPLKCLITTVTCQAKRPQEQTALFRDLPKIAMPPKATVLT